MNKLILSLTVAAFAFVPALQAGEGKDCDKAKAACAEQAKLAAKECCSSQSACAAKAAFSKKIVRSPKGMELAKK